MHSYIDKVKKYFPYTLPELRNIVLSILVIGFMYGFNDGSKEWNTINWSYNMLISIIIVAIVMLTYTAGQRFAGLSAGYKIEFQMWWPGLILALVITFITRGYIWIPIAGGVILHHLAAHRLGFFRYGINMLDNGVISAAGPFAVIGLATLLKQITLLFGIAVPVIDKLYFFSLIFALVNMLPIPPLAGSNLFFNGRMTYVYVFCFFLAYAALAFFKVYSWILGIILAAILWFLYYIKIENK